MEHKYAPGEPNCHCDNPASHAPCVECGAGPDAWQHLDTDSIDAELQQILAGDLGDGTEKQ